LNNSKVVAAECRLVVAGCLLVAECRLAPALVPVDLPFLGCN
jgi:hypothetical protein